MKTKIFALAAAALVIGGLSSCNKTENQSAIDSNGSGNLNLTITFSSSPSTKLSGTEADYLRPSSDLSDLVSLSLIFVRENETTVALVQDVTTYIESGVAYVSGIPTGTYTVYALANYTTASTTAYQYGYGGLPSGSFSLPQVGDNLTSVGSFDIVSVTLPDGLFAGSDDYSAFTAAPNYFVGSATSVEIVTEEDTDAEIQISRPVNLVRAKVSIPAYTDDGSANPNLSDGQPVISLSDDSSKGMALRRVQSSYNFYTGNYAFAASPAYTMSYSATPFTTISSVSDLPAGYIGSTDYLTEWSDDGYIWYKDMLVFPPDPTLQAESEDDSDQNPDRLNVTVFGVVTADTYTDRYGDSLSSGDQVSWYGSVDLSNADNYDLIGDGNVIVVLNISLVNRGDGGEVPPIENTGNLYATITVLDWTAIIEGDVSL